MSADTNSVRLKLLDAIKAAFLAVKADEPAADPYGFAFSTVALGPLMDWDQRKRTAVGIVAGPESPPTYLFPFAEIKWTVNVEFRMTVNRDDPDPGELIERLLCVVQRVLTKDRTWGGLAIDTKLTGSEIDLVTYADRSAVGVQMIEIQYRRDIDDPRMSTPKF